MAQYPQTSSFAFRSFFILLFIAQAKFDLDFFPYDSNGGGFNLTENWSELGNCYAYNSAVSIYNNYQ
jgi:hypothetical protein